MPWEIASVIRCDSCTAAFEVRSALARDDAQPLPWNINVRTPALPVGWTAARGKFGCPIHPVSLVELAKPRLSVVQGAMAAIKRAK